MIKTYFKNIFIVVGLLFLNQLEGQKLIDTETKSFLDLSSQEITFNFKEYEVKGTYELVKPQYTSGLMGQYVYVDGGELQYILKFDITLFPSTKSTYLKEVFVVEGTSKKVKNTFLKKGLNGISVLFNERSEGINDLGKWESETVLKENEEKERLYDELTNLFSYLGVYRIKILRSGGYDYSNLNEYGKLVITEYGITIETEIPSIKLVRSSHNKTGLFTKPSIGVFYCLISEGFGDDLVLSFNENKISGGFTVLTGSSTSTTTFIVE